MGWDGVLWAVHAQGAPHVFDPIAQAWSPHGTGADAAAWVSPHQGRRRGSSATPTPTPAGTPAPLVLAAQAAGADGDAEGAVLQIVARGAPPAQAASPTRTPAPPPTAAPLVPVTPAASTRTATPTSASTQPTPTVPGTPTVMPAEAPPAGLLVFRGPEVLSLTLAAQRSPGPATPPLHPGRPRRPPPPPCPLRGRPRQREPWTRSRRGRRCPSGRPFPSSPPSFQQGVDGAADVSGVLYLFKAGRYARADGAAPPAALSALAGWPTTPEWKDGALDLVGSGHGDGAVVLIRGGQFVIADLVGGRVFAGPEDLSVGYAGDLLARLRAGGVDALLYDGTVTTAATPLRALHGPAVASYRGAQAAQSEGEEQYLPAAFAGWPSLWNPMLLQAPAGRWGPSGRSTPPPTRCSPTTAPPGARCPSPRAPAASLPSRRGRGGRLRRLREHPLPPHPRRERGLAGSGGAPRPRGPGGRG